MSGRHRQALFAALGLAAGILAATVVGPALSAPSRAGAADNDPVAVDCGQSPGLNATPSTARGFLKMTIGSTAFNVGLVAVRDERGAMAGIGTTACPVPSGGPGGGTANSSLTPFVVLKRFDSLSLPLTDVAMRGTHVATVVIEERRLAGTAEGPFLRVTLSDVTIGRLRSAWAKGGTAEEVSLLPVKVKWESFASLTATAPTQTECWNSATRVATC